MDYTVKCHGSATLIKTVSVITGAGGVHLRQIEEGEDVS